MTSERLSKDEIFNAAADLVDAAERQAYLDKACAGDSQLRAEIEDLLKRDEEAGSFLESPLPGLAETIDQPITEKLGTQIGPYKLLQQIGEGGMGVVYMAEQQEPVKRRVALKIIKPGMDSRQVIARFEAERQALAMMDHPNIAKVLDAGTTDASGKGVGHPMCEAPEGPSRQKMPDTFSAGRPYFVMELVKGIPITEYCDQHQLTTRDRLQLFASILHAVQHAHHKGVIHRDLKPSNVMVAEYDDRAVPKIIDFGVAKATGQTLTEKTMFTAYGQLVGTLEYMSPEQAKLNQLDIDTRSDIYSLGVLLYELLTGNMPFDKERLRSAAFDEMLRIIREEEPPRPSIRLSTVHTLPAVAANRQIEPDKLSRLIRGELDWIVMKALEKDRTRRYETAAGFADDVERYLNDEAVQACPPTMAYRLRKFARRNKGAFAIVASLSLILMIVAVVSVVAAARFRDLAGRNAQLVVEKDEALYNAAVLLGMASEERERAEQNWENARLARESADAKAEEANLAKHDAIAAREKTEVALARSHYFLALARWDEDPPRVREARELLETVPEKHRHFEWYLAERQFEGGYATLVGHELPVSSVDFSSDGAHIVSGSHEGSIKIWDGTTGQQWKTLEGHSGPVCSVSFSPDGQWIVSGSHDKTIKIWEVSTGHEVRTLEGHAGKVHSVSYSPDGQWIVSGSDDKTIKIWEASSGQESLTLEGHSSGVRSVKFSPDAQRIVSGAGSIRVWELDGNAATARPSTTITGPLGHIRSVNFSPDGRKIVSGSYGGAITIWDVSSGQKSLTLAGHADSVHDVRFSPDGRRIVSASSDTTIRIWDATTGQEVTTLKGHVDAVNSATFSPDGQRIVSGSDDTNAMIWDITTNLELMTLRGHGDQLWNQVASADYSPDGQWIVSGSGDKSLKLWDAATGRELRTLEGHGDAVKSVSFSPDGKWIVSGSADNTIKIWDVLTWESRSLEGHSDWVQSVSFSPDGRSIVSASNDKTVRIWNASTGQELTKLASNARVYSASFSPDGKRIVSAHEDNVVTIWDALTGQKILSCDGQYRVSFRPDGQRIVAVNGDSTFTTWDANTGRPLTTFRGHADTVFSISFSPDGQRIVSGSDDNTIRIWDAETGQELRTLKGHSGAVNSVKFSPDGQWLVSASQDRTIKVWNATRQHLRFKSSLEARVRIDPYWQEDKAESAERGEDWYAATFHRAWVVKSDPDNAEAHNRFRVAFHRLQAEYEEGERDVSSYLAPIVKEVLAMQEEKD